MSIETMTKISTITVGSGGSASIEFTNIPQTYTDLHLMISLRSSRATVVYDTGIIRFNSDSGNNYSASRRLYGDGGSAISDAPAITNGGLFEMPTATGATANTFGNISIYIPNYISSNYKSYSSDGVSENNGATSFTSLIAGLWNITNPINTITLTPYAGSTWQQYSSATLYGIRKY